MTAHVTPPERIAPVAVGKHNESGFTLLEIMVAMVVLTLIVTTAFGALRLGERSWETALKHTTETETLRTVTTVLQRLFSQTLPVSWTENAQTTIAFSGDREQLRFIAPAPQHHGATGLFEYTLALEPYASANRLILYYRVHNPDIMGFSLEGSEPEQVVLVDDLKTASFSYYGSPLTDEQPQWYSQWNIDAEAFPVMVHAQIVSQVERNQWPDLYLALQSVEDK